MQISILLVIALLISGCSAKKSVRNDAGSMGITGVIIAREDADMIDFKDENRTSIGAYGGLSSGGGIGVGSGVFFSPWTSGSSTRPPMRYQVELIGGERMTVYHDSYDFQVGDCVEIDRHPDKKDRPPSMKRVKGGC